MNNRDVAIDVYNRLNRWSHGALTYFAVGIIEDELDMAFPEGAKNTEQQVQADSRKKEKPSCLGDVMDEETLIDIRRMCEIVLNNTFGNHELDSLAWYVGHHPLIPNPDNAQQPLQPD